MDRTLYGLPYEGARLAGGQLSGFRPDTLPAAPPDVTGRAPGYIPAGYQMDDGALSPQTGRGWSMPGMPNIERLTSNPSFQALMSSLGNNANIQTLMNSLGTGGTPGAAPGAIPAGFQRDASGAFSPQTPATDPRARLRNVMMGGAQQRGLGRFGAMQSSGGWRGGRMGYGG